MVTTRDESGRLESLLAEAGADVVHVPLIVIGEPFDGGRSLEVELARLQTYQWLAVTSRHGAECVGRAAAAQPSVRLAAVGTRTADQLSELAGRRPVVVPVNQTAADLVEAMPDATENCRRLLLVQADRADDTLATGLRAKGYEVTAVVGYSTRPRLPSPSERRVALDADAVAFASGSAAQTWVEAFGTVTPAIVVAIGPTTRDVANAAGLVVTHTAVDHSVEGLAAEITSALGSRP